MTRLSSNNSFSISGSFVDDSGSFVDDDDYNKDNSSRRSSVTPPSPLQISSIDKGGIIFYKTQAQKQAQKQAIIEELRATNSKGESYVSQRDYKILIKRENLLEVVNDFYLHQIIELLVQLKPDSLTKVLDAFYSSIHKIRRKLRISLKSRIAELIGSDLKIDYKTEQDLSNLRKSLNLFSQELRKVNIPLYIKLYLEKIYKKQFTDKIKKKIQESQDPKIRQYSPSQPTNLIKDVPRAIWREFYRALKDAGEFRTSYAKVIK